MEMIDRCAVDNGGCDHNCRQSHTGNDVICSCHAGYRLQSNMASCIGLSVIAFNSYSLNYNLRHIPTVQWLRKEINIAGARRALSPKFWTGVGFLGGEVDHYLPTRWGLGSAVSSQLPQLPSSFRQPHSVHCSPGSPHPVHITSSQSPPSLSSPITASAFHSRLKTHLFHKSFPP